MGKHWFRGIERSIPARVEYRETEYCVSLIPVTEQMIQWR